MITRRAMLASSPLAIAALSGRLALAQEATPTNATDPLVRYIREVLDQGNNSVIPEIIHPDIEMPSDEIIGIEDFTWRAVANYADRQRVYSTVAYELRASFTDGAWSMAVAYMTHAVDDAPPKVNAINWAAELRDGLIFRLYAGTVTIVP